MRMAPIRNPADLMQRIDEMHKVLNSESVVPGRAYRRNVVMYALVSYVNIMIGSYLSRNLSPVRLFIRPNPPPHLAASSKGGELGSEYILQRWGIGVIRE